MHGLSLVAESGAYSSLQCTGFSLGWLLFMQSTSSRVSRLITWGEWTYLPHGMWDLPGPGIELMSPALSGRFPTPGAPGKPETVNLKCSH